MRIKHGCAWKDCRRDFDLDEPMPEGWRSMQLFYAPLGITDLAQLMQPGHIWDRDCVLCPKHAQLLDAQLKDIGNRMKQTKGSA